MQTRKLSVKTVYDLTLAEGLRVSLVVHTLNEITMPGPPLPFFYTPVSLFQHSSVVSPAKIEARIDVAFDANACPARGNPTTRDDPQSSGAIVNLVSAVAQRPVAISDGAHDCDLFIAITGGVGVYLGNCCFTGTGR